MRHEVQKLTIARASTFRSEHDDAARADGAVHALPARAGDQERQREENHLRRQRHDQGKSQCG